MSSNVDGNLWAVPSTLRCSARYDFGRGVTAGKEDGVLAVEQCNKTIVEDADTADAFSDASECLDFVACVVDPNDLIIRRTDWGVAREIGHTQNVDHAGERFPARDCGEGRPFWV